MASTMRSYSQIPTGIRFLRTLMPRSFNNTNYTDSWAYYARTTIDQRLVDAPVSYTKTGNIIDVNSVNDLYTLYIGSEGATSWLGIWGQDLIDTIPPGTILRDLGQHINFTVNGQLAIQWTLAQFINGATTEGVPEAYPTTGNVWVVTYISTVSGLQEEQVSVTRIG